MPSAYLPWQSIKRIRYDPTGSVMEYPLLFVRKHADGWYDEVRYDSHERKHGRKIIAPHFHMKVRSGLKPDMDSAVAELRKIIDNYVTDIEGVIL